jgi:hypothetical protein
VKRSGEARGIEQEVEVMRRIEVMSAKTSLNGGASQADADWLSYIPVRLVDDVLVYEPSVNGILYTMYTLVPLSSGLFKAHSKTT